MAPGTSVMAEALNWWSSYYGDHQWVSVSIRFLHLAGLLVGGGSALSADRELLTSLHRGAEARAASVARLSSVHPVVVPALAVIVLTGLAMFAADADTFLASRLYWVKMALVAALLVNGAALAGAERLAARHARHAYTCLAATSAASVALWLLALLAGTWLTVGA